MRQAVQREDRHGHGRLETRLPGLDDRHEPEVGLQHETALGGLSINQRSAWFLAHRLRVALSEEGGVFSGPVEVDESYFGGRRRNMSNACRKELADTGGGAVSKTAVVGVKDRATKQVAARVVERTDGAALQGFVIDHTAPGARLLLQPIEPTPRFLVLPSRCVGAKLCQSQEPFPVTGRVGGFIPWSCIARSVWRAGTG